MIVKIAVPFWVLIIIRHLTVKVPQKGAIILTAPHMAFVGALPLGSFELQGGSLAVEGFTRIAWLYLLRVVFRLP